jgi:hypothetical protein
LDTTRCQDIGGKKLEECCREQGRLAEASEEGLGSNWAFAPMMMMMIPSFYFHSYVFCFIIIMFMKG